MGPGSDFERALLEAMTRPLSDTGEASSLLPYLVKATVPRRDVVADLMWDDFVNGG